MEFFDDRKRSFQLAMALGVIGGPLVAIGFATESVPVLVVGIIALIASGVIWALRGVREDQLKAE